MSFSPVDVSLVCGLVLILLVPKVRDHQLPKVETNESWDGRKKDPFAIKFPDSFFQWLPRSEK